jgi:hypothetical protein
MDPTAQALHSGQGIRQWTEQREPLIVKLVHWRQINLSNSLSLCIRHNVDAREDRAISALSSILHSFSSSTKRIFWGMKTKTGTRSEIKISSPFHVSVTVTFPHKKEHPDSKKSRYIGGEKISLQQGRGDCVGTVGVTDV